jgi:hypothetical protein
VSAETFLPRADPFVKPVFALSEVYPNGQLWDGSGLCDMGQSTGGKLKTPEQKVLNFQMEKRPRSLSGEGKADIFPRKVHVLFCFN